MNTELPRSLKDLKALFPYQLEDTPLGICLAKSWMPIFAQLCVDVDQILGEDKRGFHWSQVKEKFGSARFYFAFAGRKPDMRLDVVTPKGVTSSTLRPKRQIRTDQDKDFAQISTQVAELAAQAEAKTRKTCLACGAIGAPDVQGSYMLVLCPEHVEARRKDQLSEIWLSDEG